MPGACHRAAVAFVFFAEAVSVQHVERRGQGNVDRAAKNPFEGFFSAVGQMGEKKGGFLKSNETVKSSKGKAKSEALDLAINKIDAHSAVKAQPSGKKHDKRHVETHAEVKHQEIKTTPKRHVSDAQLSHKIHHADHYADSPAITRTCELGDAGCKSMCLWLKMTDKEVEGRCPLFEWQLRSCGDGYTAPDQRAADEPDEPMDCAVNLLRTNVEAADVGNYVHQLDVCISSMPSRVARTCSLALDLARGEMDDWKKEAGLVADAAVVRDQLNNASAQAQVAIDTKSDEQAAIDVLAKALAEAEKLPGHYLVEDVHRARTYLDTLGPIPAVRAQLSGALEDGKHSFETTSLFKVKESIVWLQVAINKAKRYGLGDPLPEAQQTLQQLNILKSALMDLKKAIFQGNVSVGTKSTVPESLEMLNVSINRAKAAGLTNSMPIAHDLLHQLEAMNEAVINAAEASAHGKAILEPRGDKGRHSLKESVKELNTSLIAPMELGLADNATITEASGTLDRVKWVKEAREALYRTNQQAGKVLADMGGVLNDDAEEVAIDLLSPAIEWAEEAGLRRGVKWAKDNQEKLVRSEDAKENMAKALALGSATLKAKSKIQVAIDALKGAIVQNARANVTAGVPLAKKEIEMLEALLGARAALEAAAVMANESLRTRTGYDDSLLALNSSIGDGIEVGLKPEVEIAQEQMQRLEEFAVADANLREALAKRAPPAPPPRPAKLNDTVPDTQFNRTGYKVEDLPEVINGMDDGDSDFDEHIKALVLGIARGKREGAVDPEMKAQLATEVAKRDAYRMLRSATIDGADALDNKTHIERSITLLTTALKEAREMGVTLRVQAAQTLLDKLNIIQPARDELMAASLQANVSMHTVSGMDASLVRISEAIELNKKLELYAEIPKAERLMAALLKLKKAYVDVKAAVMQGQIALKKESGEEAAIVELNAAIEAADEVNLHKGLPVAVDLLNELIHMNAQHQQLQAAMDPTKRIDE